LESIELMEPIASYIGDVKGKKPGKSYSIYDITVEPTGISSLLNKVTVTVCSSLC